MTMGFRNRPNPGRGRHDASPMTGRIVVGVICFLTAWLGLIAFTPLTLCLPLALAGLYGAVLHPEMFE